MFQEDNKIVLTKPNGENIFEQEAKFNNGESEVTINYLGFSAKIGYHLLQYNDPLAPFKYYKLIGSLKNDTIRLNSFPKINKDGFMIDIQSNMYDNLTYFLLYELKDDQFTKILDCSFDEWMVTGYDTDIQWSEEGALIIPYFTTAEYWDKRAEKPSKHLCLSVK